MKKLVFLTVLAAWLLSACATHAPTPAPATPAPEPASAPAAPPAPGRVLGEASTQAQRCVALAMYWEARGEGRVGMMAVGAVVMNRVASQAFPNDPCSVVHQGGETPPCQFSWWCDGRSDRPRDQKRWAQALDAARGMLMGPFEDPTHGALFFHSASIDRPWQRQQTARIGGHVFYR
ncbi:MAG: cell wall hydrolase [Pseudomonadales bacterium]|jgi:spore germination cell wall hydrolase CwlJ-like protein